MILFADWCELTSPLTDHDRSVYGLTDDGAPAWRISFLNETCIPIKFARRIDAERAIAALSESFDLSIPDVLEGEQEFIQAIKMIAEAMAW